MEPSAHDSPYGGESGFLEHTVTGARYRSCQLGGVGRLLSQELAVAQHRKQPAGPEHSTPAPVSVGVGRRVPLANGPSLQPPFRTENLSRRQPRPMASCVSAGPLWPSCSMDLPVLEEGRAVFEGATALGALMGPLLGVEALVAVAVGPGSVGLPAQATLVGALAGVDLSVLVQPRAGHVGLPTLAAAVGPLPRMHPLVQDEALVVFEELPALPALVRPLSDVHLPVPNESGQHAEGLPALAALVRPLSGVDSLVQDERVLAVEGLPALGTLERLDARVNLLVLPQFRRVTEGPATLAAHMGRLSRGSVPVRNQG